VRPLRIIVYPPAFQKHPGLSQGIEDLPVQQLVPQLAVERLNVAVLPGTTRFDEQSLNSESLQPLPNRRGRELRTVVRPEIHRRAPLNEQVRQRVNYILRSHLPAGLQSQAFPGVLIDDRENPQRPVVVGPLEDKIIRPEVVGILCPTTHARPVVEPQRATLRLSLRYLQPLPAPDPLHPLMVHSEAFISQQSRNPSITVPPVLARQLRDPPGQPLLQNGGQRVVLVSRPRLTQHPAGSPL